MFFFQDEETKCNLTAQLVLNLKRLLVRLRDEDFAAELGVSVTTNDRKRWYAKLDQTEMLANPRPVLALLSLHESVQIWYVVYEAGVGPLLKQTFGSSFDTVVHLTAYKTHWTASTEMSGLLERADGGSRIDRVA